MRYRRNPSAGWWERSTDTLPKKIAWGVAAFVGYRLAQGGAIGRPIQTLVQGVEASGNALASGTEATLGFLYPVAPSGAPAQGPTSNVSGPNRVADTRGARLTAPVDLNNYDPGLRGVAWDGNVVYTINEGLPIATAQTSVEAVAAARRFFTG